MTRLPPARVVRAASTVRTALQSLTRRMAPPEVCLLELASAFMTTRTVYAAARLGIADVLANGPLAASDVAAAVGRIPTPRTASCAPAPPSASSERTHTVCSA